jgi:hypothetical protein
MENRFLHDFMRRQATLIPSGIPEEKPTKKAQAGAGTRDGKKPFGGDDMEQRLTTLIKEKPPRKDVLAYFRDRVAELVEADSF